MEFSINSSSILHKQNSKQYYQNLNNGQISLLSYIRRQTNLCKNETYFQLSLIFFSRINPCLCLFSFIIQFSYSLLQVFFYIRFFEVLCMHLIMCFILAMGDSKFSRSCQIFYYIHLQYINYICICIVILSLFGQIYYRA